MLPLLSRKDIDFYISRKKLINYRLDEKNGKDAVFTPFPFSGPDGSRIIPFYMLQGLF